MSETANSKNLGELRKSIDEIDAAIVKLLAERMRSANRSPRSKQSLQPQ